MGAPPPLDHKEVNGIFGGVRTLQKRMDRFELIVTKDLGLWKEICALQVYQREMMTKLGDLVTLVQRMTPSCADAPDPQQGNRSYHDLSPLLVMVDGKELALGKFVFNKDATPFTPVKPCITRPEVCTPEKNLCAQADLPATLGYADDKDLVEPLSRLHNECLESLQDLDAEPVHATVGGDTDVEFGTLTHLHELCLESLELLTVDQRLVEESDDSKVVNIPLELLTVDQRMVEESEDSKVVNIPFDAFLEQIRSDIGFTTVPEALSSEDWSDADPDNAETPDSGEMSEASMHPGEFDPRVLMHEIWQRLRDNGEDTSPRFLKKIREVIWMHDDMVNDLEESWRTDTPEGFGFLIDSMVGYFIREAKNSDD